MLATLVHGVTATTGAWMAYAVGRLPDVREPAAADLAAMPYLQAVVTEVLRLYPPAVVSARHVATAFDFGGKRIRLGTLVLFSPYVTHRMAGLYPEPERFRPERWIEDGSLRRAAPHEFLPFGGGAHRCIGSAMATTQLQGLLARLLVYPASEVLPQRLRPTGFAAMRPKGGLRVAVPA